MTEPHAEKLRVTLDSLLQVCELELNEQGLTSAADLRYAAWHFRNLATKLGERAQRA